MMFKIIRVLFLAVFFTSGNAYAYNINDYGEVDLPISGTVYNVPLDHPTIQSAIDAASSGDSVFVAAGTYYENINFNRKTLFLISKEGPLNTIISGINGTVITPGPSGKIYGFTITNGKSTYGAGINIRYSGLEIKYNIFENNTQFSGGFGAAIAGNNVSTIIENNIFKNNTCDNQYTSGVVSFVNSSSPYIANNVFDSNQCRAINFTVPSSASPTVINNTIVRNTVGIYVDRRINSSKQTFRNNIIYGNEIGVQMRFGSDTYNPIFENNLVYNNTTEYLNITNQSGTNGNLSTDPLFMDPLTNLHLQRGSPAIDAGNPTNAPTTDFDNEVRPFDGNGDGIAAFDIGADEYSSKLTISIAGGATHECSSTGGSTVDVSAVLSSSDDPLESIIWYVNNIEVATNPTAKIFIPLGNNEILAKATTLSGKNYSASVDIEIKDTIAPKIDAYFIDQRTKNIISDIDSPNVQWAVSKFDISDTCDANPTSKAIGGIQMFNDATIKIQGNLNTITLESNQLSLHVSTTDYSGNTQETDAVLNILE